MTKNTFCSPDLGLTLLMVISTEQLHVSSYITPQRFFVSSTGAELFVENLRHAHKANEYMAATAVPFLTAMKITDSREFHPHGESPQLYPSSP
jgi:hypothetical protein